jgi:hypothetical protein
MAACLVGRLARESGTMGRLDGGPTLESLATAVADVGVPGIRGSRCLGITPIPRIGMALNDAQDGSRVGLTVLGRNGHGPGENIENGNQSPHQVSGSH